MTAEINALPPAHQAVDIPASIKKGRNRRNLSQRELASLLKVTPSAVAQWEGGETEPSIGNRVALSAQLDIPFCELLPEGASNGEVTISDPREKILVQKFRLIPEQLRQAYLQILIAQAEVKAPPPNNLGQSTLEPRTCPLAPAVEKPDA